MKDELIIKKCLKCGAVVNVLENCNCDNCGITCCGEKMKTLTPGEVDAAKEKHVPTFSFEENILKVEVNHVMEEEHYIKWICLKNENEEHFVYLKPGKDAKVEFLNVKTGTLYAYCNKHGLWSAEIK